MKSLRNIANLGLDPFTISLLVSLISTAVSYGLSAYTAAQQAKQQANIQRDLIESEISEIAVRLANMTTIPYSQWYTVLKMTFTAPIITPPEPPPPKQNDKTLMYIVFGALGLLFITRR